MTRTLVALMFIAGCGEQVVLSVPALRTSGTELLLLGDTAPRAGYALDLADEATLEFTVMPKIDRRIEAWISDLSPAQLSVTPGEIAFDEGLTANQLGLFFEVFTATVAGQRIEPWREGESEWRSSVRFPPSAGCLPNGGCFDEASPGCLVPCPTLPPPDPPKPPEVPAVSCAPGWETAVLRGGISVCTPWIGDVPECMGSDTIFPGEASCHPLGPGCPAGDFPTDVPSGPRLYVLEGAIGGDGSESSPLGSIQQAIDRATNGDVIVIGSGTYPEAVTIGVEVALVGACPERTVIDASSGPAISVLAPDASIHNLSIRSSDDGVVVANSASVLLEDTLVDATGGTGLSMPSLGIGGLRRVVFRDTGGPALSIDNGAVLAGDRVHIHGAKMGAIDVDGGEVSLFDSVVRDSLPATIPPYGSGAYVRNGALSLTRTIFSGNAEAGVATFYSDVEIDQTVIRSTERGLQDTATDGVGLLISTVIGTATVRHTWLDTNRSANLLVQDTVVPTTIEDTVMSNARGRSEEDLESGVNVSLADARVTACRIAALDAASTAIVIRGRGVALSDVTVLGAGIALAGGEQGDGIRRLAPAGGDDDTFARVRIEDAGGQAIALTAEGTSHGVMMEDVDIARAGAADCFECGGLCVYDATFVRATRIRIDAARASALLAEQGANVTTFDLSIRGTLPAADCQQLAGGNRGIGVRADGAIFSSERFVVEGSAEVGVDVIEVLGSGTKVDLERGAIENNPIGANVLVEGYDVRRLGTLVRYQGNGTALDFGTE